MKNLESRLNRLEQNSGGSEGIVILVKTTLEEAVKEFNELHKTKYTVRQVSRWKVFWKDIPGHTCYLKNADIEDLLLLNEGKIHVNVKTNF